MNKNLQCPVDGVTINENKARIVALFVFILILLFLWTGNLILVFIMLADFLLRTVDLGAYSPLALAAGWLVRRFKISYKATNNGPKRFAAGTGFVFALLILLSAFINWPVAVLAFSLTLTAFSFLESAFAFCAGCHVYSFLQKVSLIKSSN